MVGQGTARRGNETKIKLYAAPFPTSKNLRKEIVIIFFKILSKNHLPTQEIVIKYAHKLNILATHKVGSVNFDFCVVYHTILDALSLVALSLFFFGGQHL